MDTTTPPERKPSRSSPGARTGRRRSSGQTPPPRWLMVVLALCLAGIVLGLATRPLWPGDKPGSVAEAAMGEEKEPAPTPEPTFTPEPTPAPTPTPEPTLPPAPTPEPTAVPEPSVPPVQKAPTDGGSRFSDAVFIGDSRIEGFRLYSGVTTDATFLDHTGLTVYEVNEGKKVIRRGDKKVSVLDALSEGTYGKVYIALGINELGYFDPEGFAETYSQVVDAIRECQPSARIYIQSLLPVNTEKCSANDIPYYITNEGIANYNAALETRFADQDVSLLGVPDGLTDENGEVLREYSADGVHFQKDGYVLWLDYLSAHTEG